MSFEVDDITLFRFLATLVVSIITYATGLAIARAYISPLSKFPGPKLAAITYFYEFYYDWWLSGQYIFEIERLHKKYGELSTKA